MKYLLLIIFSLASFVVKAQTNFTFLGNKTYSSDLSDIWGYAANGREYALTGVYNGVSIVDVTDPTTPAELFFIPGNNSYWRDIKTWKDHAYVTNERGGGLLIIDLTHLPDSIGMTSWTGGSLGLVTAHNIFIDENGVAYIVGGNSGAGRGAIFLDVDTDPMNPVYLGEYNQRYVHDIFVRGDTMWTAEIDNGIFSVTDVSDKSNPVVLASNPTPGNYTHNLWLSDDGNYLLTTDEKSNAVIGAYDVSDLSNITLVDVYQSNPGSGVIPHNVIYKGDFALISYYRDGIILLDATNPANLVEMGNYDTSPFSGNGFNGVWGVYPYLPSGNILATDIEQGLFVLGITYQRACYLEGTVTDFSNNSPLNNVDVEIFSTTTNTSTTLTGKYSTGIPDSGTYTVQYTKPGYITHVENNVVLENGVLKVVNVQLVPLLSITLYGTVIDSATGDPLENARVLLAGADTTYLAATDTTGAFYVLNFQTGSYTVYAGKWGHQTKARNIDIITSNATVEMKLEDGYYDDFLFDFGWNVSGNASTGIWEKDDPIGTIYNSEFSNPGNDVANDFGLNCYVTGNGGGSAGDDDVDNGTSILTSPVFNIATYDDPYIHYYRWFYNGGGSGAPNDELIVKLANDLDTVVVETIDVNTPNSNSWIQHTVKVTDFLPPSDNMSIIFETADLPGSGHLVEAGIDLFQIIDSANIPPQQVKVNIKAILGGPYSFSTGLMKDDLRINEHIPLLEPYSSIFVHFSPGGGETIDPAILQVTGDNAIVDWVFIELRDKDSNTDVVATRSALIQRDGNVVDTDGLSPVAFNGVAPDDYLVTLRHRNHFSVMTRDPHFLSSSETEIDFTNATGYPTYGTGAQRNYSGTMLMWSGDVNHDGVIKYSGFDNDRDPILQKIGGSAPTNVVIGYYAEDVNMDGVVRYSGANNDRDIILVNIGGTIPTSTIQEQLP